jgi:hypothetical protein
MPLFRECQKSDRILDKLKIGKEIFGLRRIQAQSGTSSKWKGLSNKELSVPGG